jgi:hypothetical protein
MMKPTISTIALGAALLLVPVALQAQSWKVTMLPQISLSRFDVPVGNYSAITWLGGDQYALVSDKEPTDGFYPLSMGLDPNDGTVLYAHRSFMHGNPSPDITSDGNTVRDCEGMVYHPATQSYFISGEGDQQILEYDKDGRLTGRKLAVPEEFAIGKIATNYGFEALAYDANLGRFYTTTESTMPADGLQASPANRVRNRLRIQTFNEQLQPAEQYAYYTDVPTVTSEVNIFAFGVVAMTALPDSSLLVMEREAYSPVNYIGSMANIKIYRVVPSTGHPISSSTVLADLPEEDYLQKELIASFSTSLKIFSFNFANYEGMCLGPKLNDGRQTLILVSDSQGGFGNKIFHLRDYLRVLILEKNK